MRDWLIKKLGGYTKSQHNLTLFRHEHEFKRLLWIIANQQEKLEGALVTSFAMYGNSPESAYTLAKSYTKEIKERTNRNETI